ncbi:biotin transporter BioY [Trichococcus pasteurii]|uniref:Biotin transporter n=1 Tax=Trichococcus pasteurii TaxID=43064 RepID=A0A1W1IEX9_9LACT|nr:ECF transporter S component [Trichococcus pasteurii]SFE16233.1 biotin transport system substrate-specific component [Trichococcus pasteurii]SLM51556.1 bioy protein [Trichococcus pasteurii]SSB92437.1 bioy protein [Trichococcus pasteurii]
MKLSTRDLTQISIFAALTFVSYFISIPVGPVPITLQTLLVLLTGFFLRPRAAFFAQTLHLIMKVLLGGFQSFVSPSFGFVFGFIAAATLISYLVHKKDGNEFSYGAAAIAGTIVMYAIGLPYLAMILNGFMGNSFGVKEIFEMGMLLFIPGDIAKGLLAVILADRLKGRVRAFQH